MIQLKKACNLVKLNWNYLRVNQLSNEPVICLPLAIETDEQWSYIGNKKRQRWLWVAFGHFTHEVIAYCFGPRTDTMLQRLQQLLQPFNVVKWFTDGLAAYQRWVDPGALEIGKRNTQKIERFFLTARTRIKRLARKTLCFSKSDLMHDTIIGLFINRDHFGRNI